MVCRTFAQTAFAEALEFYVEDRAFGAEHKDGLFSNDYLTFIMLAACLVFKALDLAEFHGVSLSTCGF